MDRKTNQWTEQVIVTCKPLKMQNFEKKKFRIEFLKNGLSKANGIFVKVQVMVKSTHAKSHDSETQSLAYVAKKRHFFAFFEDF